MKTITRDIISSNFVAVNLTDNRIFEKTEYNKQQLVEKINFWKYVLRYKCKAKHQESIVIANQNLDINYFAIIFAAAELSLKIVVIDYIRADNFHDLEFRDPKTEVLSPIDIFLHDLPTSLEKSNPEGYAKYSFFTKHSNRAYSIYEDLELTIDNQDDYNEAISVFPNPEDIIIRSTSSGTTNKPKVVEHNHAFINAVSNRNSSLYDGTALHVKNLNHGATAAVTLFPVLISDAVDKHLIYSIDEDSDLTEFVDTILEYKDELTTVSFPYPYLTEKFIKASKTKNIIWPKLRLVTLSYILESVKLAIRDGVFKSITSIFGSNETLGPIFVNIVDKDTWDRDPRYFTEYDKWYNTRLDEDGKIIVTLPEYNVEATTNDFFKQEGSYFVHQGRSDMLRINGEHFELATINKLNKQNQDYYVVADTLNHCLYLAHWEDKTQDEIDNYVNQVESNFTRIKIKKVTKLIKNNFYYGIKIDNALLREYFRTHID